MGGQHWKKDNTGKRYGQIIVLKDTGKRQNRKVVWECQCDCGNIFEVRSDKLNSGQVVCCPECSKKEKLKKLNINAQKINIGDKYEKLTIIKILEEKDSSGCFYLLCKCDCGNIKKISRKHWKETKSCGCFRQEKIRKDITNQKFGKLTAIKRLDKKDLHNNYFWQCICDCGRTKEVITSSLLSGHTTSCGKCMISKGEYKIQQILEKNSINFELQKTFNTCRFPKTNVLARFDFYLPDYNILIEYDGEQHFQNTSSWEPLKNIQERDNFKTQWAKENNIILKRIPYYDYNKITLQYILNN